MPEQIPKWNDDIAPHLDPMMPQSQYDAMRQHFFQTYIVPQIKPEETAGTWTYFKSKTERPSLLNPAEKILVQAGVAATAGTKTMLGIGSPIPQVQGLIDKIDNEQKWMKQLADREGMGTGLAEGAGTIAGMSLPIEGLLGVAGKVAGPIAKAALEGAKAQQTATKLLRGGMAFAAFDAASEQHGDRLVAGLKGAATGLAWETVLLPFGRAGEAAESSRKAVAGEAKLPPPGDVAAAQNVTEAARVAQQEGRVKTPVVSTRNVKNMNVTVTDAQGNQQVLPVVTGREDTTYAKVKEILDGGGSIDSIQHNPKLTTKASEFLRKFGDDIEPKYTGTTKIAANVPKAVVERAKAEGIPIREADGGVEVPAEQQKLEALEADLERMKRTAKDPFVDQRARQNQIETVEGQLDRLRSGQFHVEQTPSEAVSPSDLGKHFEEVSARQEEKLGQAKRPTAPMDFSGSEMLPRAGAPPVQIQFPDKISEALYRTGQLRQRSQMAGMPDPFHRRMNEMMGSIAEVFGIPSREEAGRAALNYFDETNLAAKSAQGTTFAAESQMERLQKFGETLGGTRGERPSPLKSIQVREAEAKAGTGPTLAGPAYSADVEGHTPAIEGLRLDPIDSIVSQLERSGQFRVRPEGESAVVPDIIPGSTVRGATAGRMMKGPFVLIKQGASAGDVFHEWLHSGMFQVGSFDKLPQLITDLQDKMTAQGIINALRRTKSYSRMRFDELTNEAFVHAATAVRTNDVKYLARLGEMDTDVDAVLKFVNSTAGKVLEHSREQIDSVPARILQRRLEDVSRRSSTNIMDVIGRQIEKSGGTGHYDPSMKMWLLTDSEGRETAVKTLNQVWDWMAKRDPQDMLPSVSFAAEIGGVRGPIFPEATEPFTGPINPELEPARVKGLGISAISALFRPMLPWVSSLDQKLRGLGIPLYDTVKAVDSAHIVNRERMMGFYDELSGILKGTKSEKQKDLFQLLTHEPEHWDDVAEQLKLTDADRRTAQKVIDWAGTFKTKTDIDVMKYMRESYPQLREAGFNPTKAFSPPAAHEGLGDRPAVDFWERAVYNHRFEPQDTNLGRLLSFAVRQDFNYGMRPTIRKLDELISFEKDRLGPTHWALNNYSNYMKGVPDLSGQMIESFTNDVLQLGGAAAKRLNKYLPAGAKLSEDWGMPRPALAKLMQLTYAAGLAGRPATLIRDVFSGLNGLYVMGPSKYASGLTKALTSKGWQFARENGWLLEYRNVGEMYGDILGEMEPSQMSSAINKLMAPNSAAHNIGRAAAGHAAYDSAIDSITKYRAGKIGDPIQVLKDSGGWWADKPMQTQLLNMIHDRKVPVHDVANAIAKEVVDNTQWALRRGTQAAVLRTGMGRVFGQYGSFPTNYLDFLRRMVSKTREYPDKGLPALAAWSATQYAAYKAAESQGVDLSKWVGVSSAGYNGGPQLEAILNGMKAPENSQQGREARRQLLEYPLNFIPGNVAIQGFLKTIESNEPLFKEGQFAGPGLVRLLGFKPMSEIESDPDFADWLKFQTGFRRKP